MGVYIKGAVMPSSCANCEWSVSSRMDLGMSCYCFLAKKTGPIEIARKERMSFCPLIEVPEPHGRLGDLDELKERATKRLYSSNHGSMAEAYWAALIDLIDTAPTIIPASKEETDG